MIDSRPRRFLLVLFPALLVPLQLLLLPSPIYSATQVFSAPFWGLDFIWFHDSAITARSHSSYRLPAKWFDTRGGLVALGVTIWAQGNLMVGDYGVLNGQDIDWSGHEWRNRYELALWIAVPVVFVVFARTICSTAIFASRILIALQIVLLAYTTLQADPEARAKWEGAPDAIFEVSSTQNVFHFVLDGFQSDAFLDISGPALREEPDAALRSSRITWRVSDDHVAFLLC